jgi:RND family efflux transporter MFP subunit
MYHLRYSLSINFSNISAIVNTLGYLRRMRLYPQTDNLFRPWLAAIAMFLSGPGLLSMVYAAGGAPVVVAEAEARKMTPLVQVAGTVISRNDSRLAAQVEGQVIWVAEVGASLETGDAAARLDDVLIRDVLVEEQARQAREQANVNFNQAEAKRLVKLAKDNHAAISRLEQAQRDLSISRSELAAAKSRIAQTQEKQERTIIKAPFTGVVTEQFIQAGEWADPGTPIIRLVDTASLEAQAWIPVTALPYIATGTRLGLTIAGKPATGTVRTVVPVGDDQSRLYELRLLLDGGAWSAGQSVRVAIPVAESRSAIVIPRDALVLRREGTTVFRILEDNTAERITVETGIAEGDFIEVTGGVKPGDKVVTRGAERLRAGQEVTPKQQVADE